MYQMVDTGIVTKEGLVGNKILLTPTQKAYSEIIHVLNTKVNFDNWQHMRAVITQYERLGKLDEIKRARVLRRMKRALIGG